MKLISLILTLVALPILLIGFLLMGSGILILYPFAKIYLKFYKPKQEGKNGTGTN